MKKGTLYGISLGPGDPDLITVKGAAILGECRHVFVPRSRDGSENAILWIAKKHLHAEAEIHEIIFPTSADSSEVKAAWSDSAPRIAEVLEAGEDAAIVTRGNILLYTTYTELLRELRRKLPDLDAITIPGVSPFSAAAALTNFPLGRAREPITIVPGAEDLDSVRRALSFGGTVILMNIGRRLGGILDILESVGAIGRSVFVSHAGLSDQVVETDLRNLRGQDSEAQHLSTILIRVKTDQGV